MTDQRITVWIDADACPRQVKEIVFKATIKRPVEVVLVANSQMHIPPSKFIRLIVVEKNPDEADRYITIHSSDRDLVITADIPLAADLVEKGVCAINPRGKVYTADNVKEALATRNLMEELRSGGMIQGGPPGFSPKDKERFANSFDRHLTVLVKRQPGH